MYGYVGLCIAMCGYVWLFRLYRAVYGGDISNGRCHIAWIVSKSEFYSQQETVQMEWQSGKP